MSEKYDIQKLNLSRIIINGTIEEVIDLPYPEDLLDFCHEITEKKYINNFNVPFQPSINQWKQENEETNIEIEIRIVDNNYLKIALKHLTNINTINIGFNKINVKNIDTKKDSVINLNNSVPKLPEIFTVKFESQTLLKKEVETNIGTIQESMFYLNKKLLIKSMYNDLKNRFKFVLSDNIIDDIINKTIIISEKSHPFDVYEKKGSSKDITVTGYQTFNIKKLNKYETDILGKMLILAIYLGVGSKKEYGYGKIRLER